MVDFTFEFLNEVDTLATEAEDELRQQAETRLRKLSEGHRDVIGAAVSLEPLAQVQNPPFFYRARVVVYARPENIAAVTKEGDITTALKGALDAVERQLRKQREKLQDRNRQSSAVGANEGIYELSARELYQTYADDVMPDVWLERSRDEIAAELMTEAELSQGDAFYVADQILVVAEEIVDNPDAT